MSSRAAGAAGILLAVAASAAVAWSYAGGVDYASDAGPAIQALLAGDLGKFFNAQPAMGSFSLLLRAPFAALSLLDGVGEGFVYRLGAFPCVLAAGLLAAYLWRLMRERAQPVLPCAVVAALCVANPMTFDALQWGHPEEVLGAALCVAAVVTAGRRAPLSAGVLLGLALATKQWAALAVLPALLAAPAGRLRLALTGTAVAAVLTIPLAVGDPAKFETVARNAANTYTKVGPPNVWWPLASVEERVVFDGVEPTAVKRYRLPASLAAIAHPLIILLALPLSLFYWRRRGRFASEDALKLLALLFLLRSMLDPVNIGYYHVPFLLSLTAWEGLRRRGLPVIAMLSSALLWLTFKQVAPMQDHELTFGVYLAFTLPLAGYLAVSLYGPNAAGDRREAPCERQRLPSVLTGVHSDPGLTARRP